MCSNVYQLIYFFCILGNASFQFILACSVFSVCQMSSDAAKSIKEHAVAMDPAEELKRKQRADRFGVPFLAGQVSVEKKYFLPVFSPFNFTYEQSSLPK